MDNMGGVARLSIAYGTGSSGGGQSSESLSETSESLSTNGGAPSSVSETNGGRSSSEDNASVGARMAPMLPVCVGSSLDNET